MRVRKRCAALRAGAAALWRVCAQAQFSARAGEIPVAHAFCERYKPARTSHCSNEGGGEGFAPFSSSSPESLLLSLAGFAEVVQRAPSTEATAPRCAFSSGGGRTEENAQARTRRGGHGGRG